jgi:uncharacterized glyoxalase superfamily protein PhnB
MATGQRVPRGSRGSVAPKPAKLAKPKKAAAPASARRRPAAKPAAASKARATRKRTGAGIKSSPVIPYLTVRDAVASRAFYEKAFGFKHGETVSLPNGGLIQVVMRHAGAVAVKFSPEGVWSGSMQAPATSGAQNPIVLYVPCRKVDALTARARAAGATIATEPQDMFWGERIARIADPDGYVWCFAAKAGKFDPNRIPQAAEENQPPKSEAPQNPLADPEPPQAQKPDLDFEF